MSFSLLMPITFGAPKSCSASTASTFQPVHPRHMNSIPQPGAGGSFMLERLQRLSGIFSDISAIFHRRGPEAIRESGIDNIHVGTKNPKQFEHHRRNRVFFFGTDGIDHRFDQFIKSRPDDNGRSRLSPAIRACLLLSAHLFLLGYRNLLDGSDGLYKRHTSKQ